MSCHVMSSYLTTSHLTSLLFSSLLSLFPSSHPFFSYLFSLLLISWECKSPLKSVTFSLSHLIPSTAHWGIKIWIVVEMVRKLLSVVQQPSALLCSTQLCSTLLCSDLLCSAVYSMSCHFRLYSSMKQIMIFGFNVFFKSVS